MVLQPAAPLLLDLRAVREAAIRLAVDPIRFEDLHRRVDEVGALVCGGRRVEAALYHRGSVVDADGRLSLPCMVSPVTGLRVDGFHSLPPISDIPRFVKFTDWDGDGWIPLGEVATALAAALAVDCEGVVRFVQERFDIGQDGRIAVDVLAEKILPFCLRSGRGEAIVRRAAPLLPPAPELRRGASREVQVQWFAHHDLQHCGEIEETDLHLAVVRMLYKTLDEPASGSLCVSSSHHVTSQGHLTGSVHCGMTKDETEAECRNVPTATMETVVGLLLASLPRLESPLARVSLTIFLDLIAPSLLANLPSPKVGEAAIPARLPDRLNVSSTKLVASVAAEAVHDLEQHEAKPQHETARRVAAVSDDATAAWTSWG